MSLIQKILTKFVKNYFALIQKILKILSTHTNLSKNISYSYTFHSAHTPGIKNEWSLISFFLKIVLKCDRLPDKIWLSLTWKGQTSWEVFDSYCDFNISIYFDHIGCADRIAILQYSALKCCHGALFNNNKSKIDTFCLDPFLEWLWPFICNVMFKKLQFQ